MEKMKKFLYCGLVVLCSLVLVIGQGKLDVHGDITEGEFLDFTWGVTVRDRSAPKVVEREVVEKVEPVFESTVLNVAGFTSEPALKLIHEWISSKELRRYLAIRYSELPVLRGVLLTVETTQLTKLESNGMIEFTSVSSSETSSIQSILDSYISKKAVLGIDHAGRKWIVDPIRTEADKIMGIYRLVFVNPKFQFDFNSLPALIPLAPFPLHFKAAKVLTAKVLTIKVVFLFD